MRSRHLSIHSACRTVLLSCGVFLAAISHAQPTATPNDVRDDRMGAVAFANATIHIDDQTVVTDRMLLIRDGRIVGLDDSAPAGFRLLDMSGLHLYPSLVDLDSAYGLPDPERPKPFSFNQAEILDSETPGAYNANQAIRSDYRASTAFTVDKDKARALRDNGFAAVLSYMSDGIARGTGALVLTAEGSDNEMIIRPDASTHLSFRKGSSSQSYPISMMGAIALLRQTDLDARWYDAGGRRSMTDLALDGWLRHQSLPTIFETDNWIQAMQADRLGDEMGRQVILRDSGDAYQRVSVIKQTGASLIVPLSFPEAPDVSDPWNTDLVTLEELKHWELAPENPARLAAADIPFALTSRGAEKTFLSTLRQAVKRGLSRQHALAALTRVPAAMLGMDDQLGSLKAGRMANILVASGDLFDEDTTLLTHWIAGTAHVINPAHRDLSGAYQLVVDGQRHDLSISGTPDKPSFTLKPASSDAQSAEDNKDSGRKVTASLNGASVSLVFSLSDEAPAWRLFGWATDQGWAGDGQDPDGRAVQWTLKPTESSDGALADANEETAPESESPDETVGEVTYPFMAYGRSSPPEAETLLIRDATVWTLEDDQQPAITDVLIRNGKIAALGSDLTAAEATEVDGSGLHLTPGIIDEHSHIALLGVNDIATNSGMVRMSDVVNSEDINIYRNLAGGVTAAQLLHGSANPIGGQSALVKWRWGSTPDDMLIKDADGFIKFALGENVKRSRNQASIRYPQTRMGVEQVYRDAFSSALDYQAAHEHHEGLSRRARQSAIPPRTDLAMETMLEIINGERFVSCHSYVQSEINMLMHVADDFGFNINTFTHILEGYKVADKMAAHGAGGSTFSDWWAYKWEVRYAIPYNAALMSEAGVVTAINSDSSEMSRRLNQEAAKSVKYGGMSEVEALKMVTLNPAKLLHLDDRMGSIAVGKDADLVLWSDHPLSIDARPLKTLVDGRVLYDQADDLALRQGIHQERTRLIEKVRNSADTGKSGGGRGGPPGHRARPSFHCDSLTGFEHLTAIRGEGL